MIANIESPKSNGAPVWMTRAARHWRRRHQQPENGFVVFYLGKVCGWTHSMEETPNGWRPGCLALGAEGEIYAAAGGNYQDGAERWERRES